MITAYTLMYINSLNDLLYTPYRVKSMSVPKKKIQLNPIHCIFQGSLLFGFVSYQAICQLFSPKITNRKDMTRQGWEKRVQIRPIHLHHLLLIFH